MGPALQSAAVIESYEMRAVVLSMTFFFLLFGSYSVIKPIRDAVGTVYAHGQIRGCSPARSS